MDTAAILELIKETAEEVINPRFRALERADVEAKTSPDDLVTIADREAEALLSSALRRIYPGALVIGEEAVFANPELRRKLPGAEHAFVIDPIDGTRNFVEGRQEHGVMLAETRNGITTRGWIWQPRTGRGYVAENLEGARGVAAAPRDETVGGHQDGGATVQTLPAISGRGDPPGDLTGCGRAREGWGGIVGHDARIAGFRGPGSVASATGPRAGPAPASGISRHHRPPGSARPPPPLRERGQPRGMMKELPRAKGNPGLSTASATGWAKSMRPSTSKPGSPSGSGVVSSSE